LGPSDNSDSGSDSLGAYTRQQWLGDSDASGTGEALGLALEAEASDILPDHLVDGQQGPSAGHDADDVLSAFDRPASALDNPELIDTVADAADLAQESVPDEQAASADDLDGFSDRETLPEEAARLEPLRGHRGLQ